MDQESLANKKQDKLDQKPEDMTVEQNSSGSDNDNLSETSLSIEDGTKDLIKNKGTPEINESVQESQNSSKTSDETCKDTDEGATETRYYEHWIFRKEDQKSNIKTKDGTNSDLEDDQDHSEGDEEQDHEEDEEDEEEQDDAQDEDDDNSCYNSDPDKKAIKEEYDKVIEML